MRIEGGEHQPLVHLQFGNGDEAPLGGVELVVVRLFQAGHGDELAVGAISPPVIGAHEGRSIAGISPTHPVATMAAHIEEGPDFARGVADNEHWVLSHVGGEEVPRLGHLAFMTEKEPRPGKYLLQFLLINLLVVKDAPVYQTILRIDQSSDFGSHESTSAVSVGHAMTIAGPHDGLPRGVAWAVGVVKA